MATAALNSPRPTGYDEDLAARCFPQRFRRLGSPVEYLDSVGIVPIAEFIIKGHLRHDVAEVTNVPFTVLQDWLKENDYEAIVEQAEVLSAEGLLAEGARHLRRAKCEFDLKKAKALLDHAQYMAGKKNRGMYGLANNATPPSPITYVFNVGNSQTTIQGQEIKDVIDAEVVEVGRTLVDTAGNKQTLDLGTLFGVTKNTGTEIKTPNPSLVTKALEHLADAQPEPVLVADRPVKPTPEEPDIGPFFEGERKHGAV